MMQALIRDIKRHKIGIIVGGITGAIAAAYAISQGLADLSSIAAAGKGAIDNFFAREAPVTLATYKVYTVFIMVGMLAGYLMDRLISRR